MSKVLSRRDLQSRLRALPFRSASIRPAGRKLALLGILGLVTWFLLPCTTVSGQTNEPERVREVFRQKQAEYKNKAEDPKTGWEFGQACFDVAQVATNKAERAGIAQLGIDACQKSIAADSNSAPAYYYLSLNHGQLARTRML